MTATTRPDVPQTDNPGWGFWASMAEQAATAWPIAVDAICAATSEAPEAVRAFLDSRHGRHFADEVLNSLHGGAGLAEAIAGATARFMAWTIGRSTSQRTGIPRGMPYLVGHVISEQLAAEAAQP